MKNSRKAFTISEVMLGVFVATMIAFLSTKAYISLAKDAALVDIMEKTDTLLTDAVLNSAQGYISGLGGYCGYDNSFANINAQRVSLCSSLVNYELVGTGANSYFVIDKRYGECRLYLGSPAGASDELVMYFDCNGMVSEIGKGELIEHSLIAHFERDFNSIFLTFDDAARGLFASGGTTSDGKASVHFKY